MRHKFCGWLVQTLALNEYKQYSSFVDCCSHSFSCLGRDTHIHCSLPKVVWSTVVVTASILAACTVTVSVIYMRLA